MLDFVRNEHEAKLGQHLDTIAKTFESDSANSDRTGSFVSEQIKTLQQERYLSITVPQEQGGEGVGLYTMCLLQERLAKTDSSAALVAGWHVGIVLALRETKAWEEGLFRDFCEKTVLGQTLLNACATEPDAGSPSRGGRPTTIAERVEGGFILTGKKSFATGVPMLSHILVTAYVPEWEDTAEFLVNAEQKGLKIEHFWDSMAMRGSGSHTLVLDHVFVKEKHMLDRLSKGKRAKRGLDGGGWLLHIPATYLGIAAKAVDYAISFAMTHTPASLGAPIATLAQVRERIGRMQAILTTARTLLYTVATRYDDVQHLALSDKIAARLAMRPDFAMVKHIATNTAVDVVDLAMRIVGGSSILEHGPLERCYRDVRAGLHNPPMDDVALQAIANEALDLAQKASE